MFGVSPAECYPENMPLRARLDAMRNASHKKLAPETLEVVDRATGELAARLRREPGLGVGERAPGFRLPDQNGNVVDSTELLERGPLVLTLFRGHW